MKTINLEELKEIQLNILDYVTSFCIKNDIKYFLSYGTLIGAIRHNGYIPWDDDIDICMPRPDYKKFITLFKEQDSYYKVLEHNINKKYKLPFAKVHDTRTLIDEFLYTETCYGIYIDIFPIDSISKKAQIKTNIILNHFLNTKKAKICLHRSLFNNVKIIIGKIILYPISTNCILNLIDKNATKIKYNSSEYVANIAIPYGTCEIMHKDIIETTVLHQFEDKLYMIPKKYSVYLENIYGDYMQLPPLEKRKSHHSFIAWWK